MRNIIFALCVLPLAAPICMADTGELILRAVDIDTGKPISGVSFAVENCSNEDWAVKVGKSDAKGVLRLEARRRPGYYYMVLPSPKGYKVVGLDDVYIDVVPGGTVTHEFKLRKISTPKDFPPIVPLPPNHQIRVPPPRSQDKSSRLISTVKDMPGFEGKRVSFYFNSSYSNKQRKITPEQLRLAELIFLNGNRIVAAVRDELKLFQKAVPEDRGDIDNMHDILIEISDKSSQWRFWCRLLNGLPLRQHGYRIGFSGIDGWDLSVPAYLQPTDLLKTKGEQKRK